jgi:anaerobic sulfite reductase subunit A
MPYRFEPGRFDLMLKALSERYRLYGPTRYNDKGPFSDADIITFGPISELEDLELDFQSVYSPKEILLPVNQTLFYFTQDRILEPKPDENPLILFLRPCDRNGIQRLDSIFLENGPWPDPYYAQIRNRVRFFVIECTEGFDNCFCVSMGANKTEDYDLFLRLNNDEILAKTTSSEFGDICSRYGESTDFQPAFVEKNMKEVQVPDLERMDNSIFESEFWSEYTDRCIACGRCNLSCPTCSCFTVRDILYKDNPQQGERLRFWSGCHLDGFDEVSGGITFRSSKGDRMRYKTMHKIYDFKKRFGENMCVGCGRCDNVCPQYISFAYCINKVSKRAGEGV